MIKMTRNWLLYMMAATVCFGVSSCSSDDDDDQQSSNSTTQLLVGDWLEDNSTSDSKNMMATTYTADGKMSVWFANVDKDNNMMLNYDGTYTLNDNKLAEKYVSPASGTNVVDNYDVLSVDKYTFTSYSTRTNTNIEYNRIVETRQLNVGETFNISIDDAEFIPTSYTSIETRVATVTTSGQVTAVKRGLTFIKVKSSIGTAVIRLQVNDPANVIDDMTGLLGATTTELTAQLGNFYNDYDLNAGPARVYEMFDPVLSEVLVSFDAKGRASTIITGLREGYNSQALIQSLSNKYSYVNGTSYLFQFTLNGKGGLIAFDTEYGQVSYQYLESDDVLATYDSFINMTIDEVAKDRGFTLSSDELASGYVTKTISNNKYFDQVSLVFDTTTHAMNMIRMRCKEGITRNDVEDWYKDKYWVCGSTAADYCNAENWTEANIFITLTTGTSDRLLITYMKTK